MPTTLAAGQVTTHTGSGGRLVTVEGRDLPLRAAHLAGAAEAGLATVVLKQTFVNPHAEPLEVRYTFPLPADGAVAGYEFRIGDRRVSGTVEKRADAREAYERALVEGRTAGLVDQDRPNLFAQSLGNIPPGAEVTVELRVDQRLRWLPEGVWEWRFPTVAPPRYLGAEGRVGDADRVTVDVAEGGTGVRGTLDLLIRDPLAAGGAPHSTSHAIATAAAAAAAATVAAATAGGLRVTLAAEAGVALDRDIVVRWPVAPPVTGVTLMRARAEAGDPLADHAFGLLAIVPPPAVVAAVPRDVILLIDTSGSMSGAPIDLARQAALGLVGSLAAGDRLEMIAFANRRQRWSRHAVPIDDRSRRYASDWLLALRAGGGTEMTDAIEEALRPLDRQAQRQVVLITDGQIGFEAEVYRAIRDRLPAGSRLHAIGVGTGVNRALLAPAARAGRGVEVILDLDEAPARGVERIVAATRAPILTDLVIEGPALDGRAPGQPPLAPRCPADVLAGSPVLVGVRLRPEGGALTVRGRAAGGPWTCSIDVPATATGHGDRAIAALYAREAVEDIELDRAAGADDLAADRAIEALGLRFRIATRLTSWIALSEEPSVDPRAPKRVARIPQEMPYGLSAEGLGLRAAPMFSMHMDAVSHYLAETACADTTLPSPLRVRDREVDFSPRGVKAFAEPTPVRAPRRPAEPPWHFRASWMPAPRSGLQSLLFETGDAPLDWRPAARARALLRSGRSVEVAVIEGVTTRPGVVPPRSAILLILDTAEIDQADIIAVEIESAGALLRLDT